MARAALRRSAIVHVSPQAEQRTYTSVRPSVSAFAATALHFGHDRNRSGSGDAYRVLSAMRSRCHKARPLSIRCIWMSSAAAGCGRTRRPNK